MRAECQCLGFLLFRFQITEQSIESLLVRVVTLPLAEVSDIARVPDGPIKKWFHGTFHTL